ncbi:transcriptional regulator, y4mF family [Nocardia otitidiscaviarum]|uniref:Transcriptional regulator, y4mF family n=1 Tax=Nocardia otitidiscaviarum TaxID=1823 RepID=A0A378YFW7_9NOCA|nr:helix-turn-helix transcriptional regulator [Nocardia otitidiscaviarum]SUA76014.1 transcriptional regulator, y4mF family [Nocardia otitidiscaviarum]
MTTNGIGSRIAAERKVAGLTQEAFANRIGYSKGMVRAVEQGREPASPGYIAKAALVLGVEPEHLMGTPYYDTLEEDGPLDGLADLRAILAEGAFVRQAEPAPLPELRARLTTIEIALRNDKTRKALAELPGLIRQLCGAAHTARTDDERDQAYRMLCSAWIAAEGACTRLGHSALTALILDRLDSTATHIDDPLLTVRSLMKRARLLMTHGSTEVAMSLVERGIGLAAGESEAERVLRGYGLLRGAIVAGRDRNLDLAQQFVAEARGLARPMQRESDLYTTEFGPGNVEIHACAVELEAGDPGKAAREGAALRLPTDISATRAGHHWQDNARAWILAGQPDKALHSLTMARRIAPQQTKLHPNVRESLFAIASAERRKSDSTGAFARWLGVTL